MQLLVFFMILSAARYLYTYRHSIGSIESGTGSYKTSVAGDILKGIVVDDTGFCYKTGNRT